VKIIRVMCSGRVESSFVMRAMELGADGVLVMGCHPGDCHYVVGNREAEKRMKKLSSLLDILGIGEKRLRLEWVSASEGQKFANTINEFVAEIKKLGPLPFGKKKEETK
jgi:F420-non-reducing hydrogenase iron-sulfur subunit